MMCYTPKWLWDSWEGGLVRMLSTGLNTGLVPDKDKDKKKKVLIDYLLHHVERHNSYAIRYFLCETLCLVNIIGQLYMMNHFFDGEFFSYGLRVMSFSDQNQEERVDPMVYVFPRVTKCIFHKYGASGTIQKHDSLCLLPLNIVNEKTYIFIWFWFMILAGLLTVLVLYRALLLSVPSLRPKVFHWWHKLIPHEVAEALARKTDVGDWWLLYVLGDNMDPLIYREVVSELSKKIETAASNNS
ncbi:hypothetical protein ONE63_007637 [Megalurothrips usitatus]|uniref:Innexin n=1 Tax=Megalurothrips usitatus TaxID=439358 RepID=A0AAV7XUV4_9NEOP|nr:hypothetical protein ONE63_007637 [Megalurothrips usitatus]